MLIIVYCFRKAFYLPSSNAYVSSGPPSSPTDLTSSWVTATSVTLHWFPGPDGGHQQTFSIRFRQDLGQYSLYEGEITDSLNGSITSKVSGLSPSTLYEFLVTAHNTLGASQSALVTATTRGIHTLVVSIGSSI